MKKREKLARLLLHERTSQLAGCCELVDAVLAELREPDDRMIAAGWQEFRKWDMTPEMYECLRGGFSAMIDAIGDET